MTHPAEPRVSALTSGACKKHEIGTKIEAEGAAGTASWSAGLLPRIVTIRILQASKLSALSSSRPLNLPSVPAPECQPRPSGERKPAPARPFPGGAAFLNLGGSRPSEKRPRRPTASAETRLLRRSPGVANLDVVRIVGHFGRTAQDNIKNGTRRPRGRSWDLG